MDDSIKYRKVVLFQEECRLFWQWLLVRIGIRTWTVEEWYQFKQSWEFVQNEIRRLKA